MTNDPVRWAPRTRGDVENMQLNTPACNRESFNTPPPLKK